MTTEGPIQKTNPRTVADLVRDNGPVGAIEAARLVAAVARQVADLHASGRIHREITAECVRLSDDGPTLDAPSAATRRFCGGADGASCPPEIRDSTYLDLPEAIDAARRALTAAGLDIDPRRIDVYQLGAILCWLTCGQGPAAYLRSPVITSRVPSELRPILDAALGYRADNRITTCDDLIAAIDGVDDGDRPASRITHIDDAEEEDDSNAAIDIEAPIVDVSGLNRRVEAVIGDAPGGPASANFNSPANGEKESSAVGGRCDDAAPDLPFTQLGHYKIVARLGSGGMGDVFKGYEMALDREVAIKVLPLDLARQGDFVKRFQSEARAVAKLVHPNVVQIYFTGEDSGHHYFAMQYVEGESLAELLSQRGRLTPEQALPLLEQILDGLAAAHDLGLVHRDIKPGNILIDHRLSRALVSDFGLVKAARGETEMTVTGTVMGTVDYIAPEQARGGDVDARADLYAVGVLMYRMLSGRLPFRADTQTAMIFQHAYETPPPLHRVAPDLPKAWSDVIIKLMSKAPSDRYPTARALLADLHALHNGRTLTFGLDAEAARPTNIIDSPLSPNQPKTAIDDVDVEELLAEADATIVGMTRSNGSEAVAPAEKLHGWGAVLRRWWDDLMYVHAPGAVRQWHNTQQQMDGAVHVYQRRYEELSATLAEVESVVEALAEQAEAEHRAGNEDLAAELTAQAKEQREQIEDLRSQLLHVTATLARLRSQRDVLIARLKAAELSTQDAGRSPAWKAKAIVVGGLLVACLVGWLLWNPNGSVQVPPGSVPPRPVVQSVSPRFDHAPPGAFQISGTGFSLDTLENDRMAFGNRGYVWRGVPAALSGWRYTRVAGGGERDIIVTATTDAPLYVMVATQQPDMDLSGWTPVAGVSFHYTDHIPTTMAVYRRQLKSGESLRLPQDNWTGMLPLFPPNALEHDADAERPWPFDRTFAMQDANECAEYWFFDKQLTFGPNGATAPIYPGGQLGLRGRLQGDFHIELSAEFGKARYSTSSGMSITVGDQRFSVNDKWHASPLRVDITRVGSTMNVRVNGKIQQVEFTPDQLQQPVGFVLRWRNRTSIIRRVRVAADRYLQPGEPESTSAPATDESIFPFDFADSASLEPGVLIVDYALNDAQMRAGRNGVVPIDEIGSETGNVTSHPSFEQVPLTPHINRAYVAEVEVQNPGSYVIDVSTWGRNRAVYVNGRRMIIAGASSDSAKVNLQAGHNQIIVFLFAQNDEAKPAPSLRWVPPGRSQSESIPGDRIYHRPLLNESIREEQPSNATETK